MFLWVIYPIAWGVCEGGNLFSPDSEAGFYAALDFLAKPCFGVLLLWFHNDIDPADLNCEIRGTAHYVGLAAGGPIGGAAADGGGQVSGAAGTAVEMVNCILSRFVRHYR
jgi:hypothetical protein